MTEKERIKITRKMLEIYPQAIAMKEWAGIYDLNVLLNVNHINEEMGKELIERLEKTIDMQESFCSTRENGFNIKETIDLAFFCPKASVKNLCEVKDLKYGAAWRRVNMSVEALSRFFIPSNIHEDERLYKCFQKILEN